MSQFRLARISLLLAAIGLNLAPALLTSAHAQDKNKKDAPAAAEAAKVETIRPEMFKVLDANQFRELMAQKKYADVADRLKQADTFPAHTPYEDYIIDRMRLALASATGDDATAMPTLERVIATGRMPAADQLNFIQVLANYYYNAKNYAKTVEWLKRYVKDGGSPLKVRNTVIRAYYLMGDYTNAKVELQAVIDADAAIAKTSSLEDLRLLASSAAKLKDMTTYTATMEKMVAAYPSDDYWVDLLNRMQSKPTYSQTHAIDVLRLQWQATGTLTAEDFTDLAELDLAGGFYTEAKKALDAGFAANLLGTGNNGPKHKKLRDQANKGAADDQKNIASGEASAQKSKDGTGLVNLGYAYATMGQFYKAIDLMQQGIAKGGLKKPEEAKLHLGIVFAKGDRKEDALKTFQSVKGDDGTSDLARYWILWVNRPAPAAATAAADAAPAAAAAATSAPAAAPVKK